VGSIFVIIVLLSGAAIMMPTGTATITGTPPQPGDTIINDNSQWTDEVIYLNQSLVIQDGIIT
jgi:hypothetical protein